MIRYITHTHIYIYVYINEYIVTNPYLHIIPLPGLSFYASTLIGVLVNIYSRIVLGRLSLILLSMKNEGHSRFNDVKTNR